MAGELKLLQYTFSIEKDLNIYSFQYWLSFGLVRQQETTEVREYTENLTFLCSLIIMIPFADEPFANQNFSQVDTRKVCILAADNY